MTMTMNKNSNNPKNKRSSSQLSSNSTQQSALPPPSPSQPQRHGKNIKNLHNFLTSLLVSPNPPSAQDAADLEELVSLMKKHTLFDPIHIPQLQDTQRLTAELPFHIPTSIKPSVTTITSSDSDDNNNNTSSNNSASSSRGTTTASYIVTEKANVAPVPNFEFSFSSDRQVNFPPPPEKRLYTTDRPTYRRGGVYADEYDEVEDVKLEDQIDPEELEAIIQQRKILPLPKSGGSQKHFTVTAIDKENKNNKQQNATNNNNQGLSASLSSTTSPSSKPTPGLVVQQERIARRSSGEPSNRLPASSSPSSTTIKIPSLPLPLPAFSKESPRFTLAEDKQSLKLDNNVDAEYDKKKNKLLLDNNLNDPRNNVGKITSVKSTAMPDKQQQKHISFRSEAATRGKKHKSKSKKKIPPSVTKSANDHTNDDNDNNKKNTKPSTTKKGKKSQSRLEQQQLVSSRKDWLDASDVSMIINGDQDEWICLFCQYEIFCSGLEAAIRKRGGYRRRRLLRAKDINNSILQHHHKYASRLNVKEEDEDPLSPSVGISVDSRLEQ